MRPFAYLLDLLNLRPAHAVLDLCCGQGRHYIELFKRGFKRIIGLDYSECLLELARKRAEEKGMPLYFIRGDARNPPFEPCSFDAIICIGNSFGYFSDDREDFLMIGRIADLLKKRGKLFLDLNDGEVLRNSFEARSSEWLDEKTLVNRERALARSGKRLISREIIYSLEDGLIADQIYAETLYSDSDIRGMLEKTEYTDIHVHREASVISTRNEDLGMLAHRMIITASKN